MLQVVCALIEENGCVLATQRSAHMAHPLQWEFPGGKLLPGESPAEGLIREIAEELTLDVHPWQALPAVTYAYPAGTIRLLPWRCHRLGGTIQLVEHAQYRWLAPAELSLLPWSAADREVVAFYLDVLAGEGEK